MSVDYEERKQKAREKMEEEILEVGCHQEAWERWMEFRAKFHDYSFHNRMLICAQDPHAQSVKGYRDWQTEGRQVAKGESGILIWFPFTKEAEDEEEAEEEGVDVGEEYVTGFGTTKVFAWHQTLPIVGRPPEEIDDEEEVASIENVYNSDAVTAKEAGTETLPEPIPLLSGDEHVDILQGARAFAESQGYEVTTMRAGYEAKGDYRDKLKQIRYREDIPVNQAAKTVCHELAHGITFERFEEEEVRDLGHSGREIIAEGAAYMTCYVLGFDTAEYSFPYLRSKAAGVEALKGEDVGEEKLNEVQNAIREHLRHIGEITDQIRNGILEQIETSDQNEPDPVQAEIESEA